MLFIYRVLPIGGIETFFLRMAKERYKKGLATTILLLSDPNDSNQALLMEMKKYSNVVFFFDIFYKIPIVSKYFPLLALIRKRALSKMLSNVDHVHTFKGMHALLAHRLLSISSREKIPITIGFYHYISYVWGGDHVAYHEKINRKFVFNYLPKESLLFFSNGNRDFHTNLLGLDFKRSQTFRLGVIDKKIVEISGRLEHVLKIAAVGRLVEFKTYNIFILGVVKKLVDSGIFVRLDIYGEGPLASEMQKKIDFLNLNEFVYLRGEFQYKNFDKIISNYDLFIGSGTAIIQASSLGVPAIVGIENETTPVTYGFFSNVHMYEYNLKGLKLDVYEIFDLIVEYTELSVDQRYQLKLDHVNCAKNFTNQSCQNALDKCKSIEMPRDTFYQNYVKYEISRAVDQLLIFINPKHPFNTKFKKFNNR